MTGSAQYCASKHGPVADLVFQRRYFSTSSGESKPINLEPLVLFSERRGDPGEGEG